MKVHEAIAILQEANPDAELILSSDEEGNSYRPADISVDEWYYESGDEIEVYAEADIADTEEEIDEVYGPRYLRSDLTPAVVIW